MGIQKGNGGYKKGYTGIQKGNGGYTVGYTGIQKGIGGYKEDTGVWLHMFLSIYLKDYQTVYII